MQVYNSQSRRKEEFVPKHPGKVDMYVCGITSYDYCHVGHARSAIVFDVLSRYFRHKGMDVRFVRNFTDVDDKIINRANQEGISSQEVAEKYIAAFHEDMDRLAVLRPEVEPKATENIQGMIELCEDLIAKGKAYSTPSGDVYFKVRAFDGYGKLSGRSLDEMQAGARIAPGEEKEDPMDFALWKAAKPGEPYWESPWGNGRPGWHIECSVMSARYLELPLDIHGGGQDLIFPHHENEIAQSECATGSQLANYWMRNGYINIDNKKMSKSAGNFFTTRDVAEKYGYEPIRYLMIQAHYRTPINYSLELIDACKSSLERLYNCRDLIDRTIPVAKTGELSQEAKDIFETRKKQFVEAMDDDLNTADALASVFELVRDINIMVKNENTTVGDLKEAAKIFDELTNVLGIVYNRGKDEIPKEITELVEERKMARKNKDFALADKLRDKISEMGYILEETRQGTIIKKK